MINLSAFLMIVLFSSKWNESIYSRFLLTILPNEIKLVSGTSYHLAFLDYLSIVFSDGKSTTWSVRLGQLLSAKKRGNATAFYDTLKLVRAEQIVQLSAASFERGSYQRGYEYIVRYFEVPFLYSWFVGCHDSSMFGVTHSYITNSCIF